MRSAVFLEIFLTAYPSRPNLYFDEEQGHTRRKLSRTGKYITRSRSRDTGFQINWVARVNFTRLF
jgi:hypothetical protein